MTLSWNKGERKTAAASFSKARSNGKRAGHPTTVDLSASPVGELPGFYGGDNAGLLLRAFGPTFRQPPWNRLIRPRDHASTAFPYWLRIDSFLRASRTSYAPISSPVLSPPLYFFCPLFVFGSGSPVAPCCAGKINAEG